MCWDNVVGIATCYELDGPGIESRWGRDFPHLSRWALGPTKPHIQLVPGPFTGVKQLGRGVDHPPPSSPKVKERVELYLYSPFGPSWPVLGWTFTFTLPAVNVNVCECSYIMISRSNYAASSCVVDRVREKCTVQCLTLQLVCSIAWWLYCRITKHNVFIILVHLWSSDKGLERLRIKQTVLYAILMQDF